MFKITYLFLIGLLLGLLFNFHNDPLAYRQWKRYYNYSYKLEVDGFSMVHLGYNNGDTIRVFPHKSCRVGDVCAFECRTKRCRKKERAIKQVKAILINDTGTHYWFEGRSGEWFCSIKEHGLEFETNCHSFDSRIYGWLTLADDFQKLGVVEL